MRGRLWFLILVGVPLLMSCQKSDQVCFHGRCVNVEIVRKSEDMARGLQFRKKLDPGAGMLFVFPESGTYPFWMKDTLIPLDMIWIDENRQVVALKENVPPCQAEPCQAYHPGMTSLYVLEVNAGAAQQLGSVPGATAVFNLQSGR